MDRDAVDSAFKIIEAYYMRFSALRRGLAERCVPGLAAGRTASLLAQQVAQDERVLRFVDGTLVDDIGGRVFPDDEIVAHARRVLGVWLVESLADEGADRVLLGDLLKFDPSYLYLGSFVRQLVACMKAGTPNLVEEDREELQKAARSLFSRPGGRPKDYDSKQQLYIEYKWTLQELKKPSTPLGSGLANIPMRNIGRYLIGYAPCRDEGALRRAADLHLSIALDALNRMVMRKTADGPELTGLAKVLAYHFPTLSISIDSRGIVTLADRERVSEEHLALLEPVITKYYEKGKRKRYAEMAYGMLEAKHGITRDTIHTYVTPPPSFAPTPIESIPDVDESRDWDLAETFLTNARAEYFAARTPLAQQCGLSVSELEAVIEASE